MSFRDIKKHFEKEHQIDRHWSSYRKTWKAMVLRGEAAEAEDNGDQSPPAIMPREKTRETVPQPQDKFIDWAADGAFEEPSLSSVSIPMEAVDANELFWDDVPDEDSGEIVMEDTEEAPPPPRLDDLDFDRHNNATEEDGMVFGQNYTWNKNTDTYITYLRTKCGMYVLPGPRHRQIIRAYSRYSGTAATQDEIARMLKIPREWVTEYLSIHRMTHTKGPFTDEELNTKSDDELMQDAAAMRRADIDAKIAREKWKEREAYAQQAIRFEELVLLPVRQWLEDFAPVYEPPTVSYDSLGEGQAWVINPTDLHIGKYAAPVETGGRKYDRESAVGTAIEKLESTLIRAQKWGKPSRIFFGVASDWLHVDTPNGTTTKGTPLDVDGATSELIQLGHELSVTLIDMCTEFAPVRVVPMRDSNHDKMWAQYQAMLIESWYRHSKHVSVNNGLQPRLYERWGRNMLMWTHGDSCKLLDIPELMACESSTVWGECPHRSAFTGHRHHEITLALRGVTVYQQWSLAPPDRWHTEEGFIGKRSGLAAHIIDQNEGVVGAVMAPVV